MRKSTYKSLIAPQNRQIFFVISLFVMARIAKQLVQRARRLFPRMFFVQPFHVPTHLFVMFIIEKFPYNFFNILFFLLCDEWLNILGRGFGVKNQFGVGKADFGHEIVGARPRFETPTVDWVKMRDEKRSKHFHRNRVLGLNTVLNILY